MAMAQTTLFHEGETLDEALADINSRYGVTVTLVEADSGDQGWPLVRVNAADDDQLIVALRGGFGWNDADLHDYGLLDE